MATVRTVLQHYYGEGVTHLGLLRQILGWNHAQKLFFMSAFSRAAGIDRLFENIELEGRERTVITGIRNGITSVQALRRYLQLGFATYVLDTGRSDLIYHPKVFSFHDEKRASIIFGSANLTTAGLLNNLEAGTLIELDLSDSSDESYLRQVTGSLQELQTRYPDNVSRIENHAQIDELFRRALVVDERQVPQAQGARWRSDSVGRDTPRIMIPREPDREPVDIPVLSDEPHIEQENEDRWDAPGLLILRSQLVYEKIELSRSDAQIVPERSKRTGNVRLSGANFTINGQQIDWRTYFRTEVFGAYQWERDERRPNREDAEIPFRVIINGIDYGMFRLRLSHDPDREAKQDNVPTWLHWGRELGQLIQRINIEGRSLRLYSPPVDESVFIITID